MSNKGVARTRDNVCHSQYHPSASADLAHFPNFQRAIGEHEIVAYDGHRMLGSSDFWSSPAYPGFYQVYLYGGCLGYEYYVRPIVEGKDGWKKVDIVSSVIEVSRTPTTPDPSCPNSSGPSSTTTTCPGGTCCSPFSTLKEAMETASAVLMDLSVSEFAHSVQLTYDVADVYCVLVEEGGWYLKITIDEQEPELAVISFHPLERPLKTRGGVVKP